MADVSLEGIPVIADPRNHRLRLDRHGVKRVVLQGWGMHAGDNGEGGTCMQGMPMRMLGVSHGLWYICIYGPCVVAHQ